MRLAYFSPLPPQKSGIANYSAALLPHLAQLAEVTLFVEDPEEVEPFNGLEIRAINTFHGPLGSGGLDHRFNMCLYQMGNNVRYHRGIYETLLAYPGITVLHDPYLYAFHDDLFLQAGRTVAHLREIGYGSDVTGVHEGRLILSHALPRDDQRFPLLQRIGDTSLGVITHSVYAQRCVRRRCPTALVKQINHLRTVPSTSWSDCQEAAASAKYRLGYSVDELLVGSFGYAAPTKRIHSVLRALAEMRPDFPNIRYVIVGAVIDGYDIQTLANELGLSEIVRFVGYADDVTFADYLTAIDVGVSLRHPTNGETSGAMMSMMAAGRPVLVSDTDAFAELPDEVCVKIATGANEASDLIHGLSRLAREHEERYRIGRQAHDFVSNECAPETIAQQYLDFVQSIIDDLRHRKTW